MAKKRIGELLIADGLLANEQLEKALEVQKKQGGFLGKILVELGFVTEEQVADHLMEQGGHAYLPLGCYDIDHGLLDVFTEDICRGLGVLPVDKIGNVITVAVADDMDEETMENVKKIIPDGDIKVFITTLTELGEAFDKYFNKKDQEKTT